MHPPIIVGPDSTGRALIISGDTIKRVGDGALTSPSGAVNVDCAGATIEPGQINAHTHIYSGLAGYDMPPPKVPPDDFVQILERIWWRLDRALDEVSLEAAARSYVAESLLAGTTTLIDHHESPELIEGSLDILADVCSSLGVRALLSYGATERNGGASEAQRGLDECRRFLDRKQRSTIVGAVGLHASFTVSDETLASAGALCAELGAVMHVHVAEDGADVEDAKRRGYDGVVARLLAHNALPTGSILAHGVHLTEAEVRQASERGCWFVQNPRSNDNNRVGYAAALSASHRVALGTDGFPAVMSDEAAALRAHGAAAGDPPALLDERIGNAQHLAGERFERRFGALQAGAAADLVVRGPEGVRHVIVAGRVVVRDGNLVSGSVSEIRAIAKREAARLWERMERL